MLSRAVLILAQQAAKQSSHASGGSLSDRDWQISFT